MISLSACMFLFVAMTTADGYGTPPPPPPKCYSTTLQRHFTDGARWTEPHRGIECIGAVCNKGKIEAEGCKAQAVKQIRGCKVQPGPGPEYPDCCPRVVCPRPDQCFSGALDRVFDDSATWTEPGCNSATCDNGNVRVLPCPVVRPGPGCWAVPGPEDAAYPECCTQYKCPTPEPVSYY